MTDPVDVVLVTALQDEFDAAREAFTSKCPGAVGVSIWNDINQVKSAPYIVGDFSGQSEMGFRIALARPTRIGSTPTSQISSTLAERLRPYCLAMCGVCAGNPNEVALGDVIVAELAYAYDEGKLGKDGFVGDHRQSPISDAWLRAAQELKVDGLPSYGPATTADARFWLLKRLYDGWDARKHPARSRYFPPGAWKTQAIAMEKEGLITRRGQQLKLTNQGRDFVDESLALDVDSAKQLPFAIKVGPMASGNVVVKDGVTWDKLKSLGVRTIVGLEMEAATIGAVARSSGVQEWIVIKGVMDHADPNKDDRFKSFAARASAEVLARFLEQRLAHRNESPPEGPTDTVRKGAWRPRSLDDPIFEEAAAAIKANAPRFLILYTSALEAALKAYEVSHQAHAIGERARVLAAAKIADARKRPFKKSKVFKLHAEEGQLPLMARIWNSGDEYLGEGEEGVENGLGVFKVYRISREHTPDLVSAYAGRIEVGRYGPLGVFTFANRAQFAGEWADSHPKFGYRDYFGDSNTLGCDFYFGNFSQQPHRFNPRWYPQGEGIMIDAATREIICVTVYDGIAQSVREAYRFDF